MEIYVRDIKRKTSVSQPYSLLRLLEKISNSSFLVRCF